VFTTARTELLAQQDELMLAVRSKTARRVPSGENAAPWAKPYGSGLRAVTVVRVAVLVISIGQFPDVQGAGAQAIKLLRPPGAE
jgi:hypothetical protein